MPKMTNSFQITRRSFLRRCATTAAATGLPLWFVQRELALAAELAAPSLPAPNDRPGIALIGCGGMGSADLQAAARYGNIVALNNTITGQGSGNLTYTEDDNGKTSNGNDHLYRVDGDDLQATDQEEQ